MVTTTDESPEKMEDEHSNNSSQNDNDISNDALYPAAKFNRLQDATASAAARQQRPPAPSFISHQYCAPPTHQTASSRSASASWSHHIPHSEIAQKSDVYHHPDMPFLVTHWLSHYAPPSLSEESKSVEEMPKAQRNNNMLTARQEESHETQEALQDIRLASSKLASAFEKLGAFGHSSHVTNRSFTRPTTFSDLSRTYSPLLSTIFSSSHGVAGNDIRFKRNENRRVALLDSVVSASSSAHAVATKNDLKCVMPWSLLEAAREGSVPTEPFPNAKTIETPRAGIGRRVGNSLSADSETAMDSLVPSGELSGSAMQKPILLGANALSAGASVDIGATSIQAAHASRRHLSLRVEAATQRKQMECTMQTLQSAIKHAQTGQTMSPLVARRSDGLLDQVAAGSDLDRHRIVAQLERRMHELNLNHSCTKTKVSGAEMEAEKSYSDLASSRMQYQTSYRLGGEQAPLHQILQANSAQRNLGFGPLSHTPGKNNIARAATLTRQYHGRHLPSTYAQTNLSVLKSRLSHAATISCHLVYPVYCLKFDKTGRYFITGSDDQVAKLFHLGAGRKDWTHDDDADFGTETRSPALNYGANARGAVLVCTLRGHAGVVADIDVNVDNALVATASGDGDVRVWGLKDGCPVAILRGHKDGANMVSWSTLTPFRLVTCGEDGLARMWDVRKAALKRYGDFIDNWSQYSKPEQEVDITQQDMDVETEQENFTPTLPPIPLQLPSQEERQEDDSSTNNLAGPGLGGLTGDFVANSQIDEGVVLVAQLQHGALVEENLPLGRVTRTSRKAVKVMCLARCPVGGHFATGSDDGLGRVWADDDDDWHVESLGHELSDFVSGDGKVTQASSSTFLRRKTKLKPSRNAPSQERLLATLRGHNNAVTDMKYSSAGDRILTASMKDGVACVWSWGKDGAIASVGNLAKATSSGYHPGLKFAKFSNISQLLIQLTHVSSSGPSTTPVLPQKATPANCDGVTWTCDDMKIVTSQSSPAKAGSADIIPGSQMIYIWDSHSGKCLMGIMSSHSSLCSTLAPHPTLSSVIASAGSDGVVNVWDLDRGDCFCTHTNTLLYGPAEPATDRGKQCGYLDVQFSPDGLHLVLTDENGRVTILDTLVPAMLRTGADTAVAGRYSITSWSSSTPAWMKEQYFASDYYELFYETNGYCVERGSELPPHIAPKGVRCTHEGISHSENIREVYRQLEGPLPLPQNSVRWHRDDIRAQSTQVRLKGVFISGNAHKKPKKIVGNTELYQGRASTAIINTRGQLVQPERIDPSFTNSNSRGPRITGNRSLSNSTSTGSHLSSRYRWVGFADVPETEDENEEHSDDAYEGNGRILEESSSEDDNRDGVSRPHRRPRSVRGRGRLGQSRRRERSVPAGESQEQRRRTRASSRRIAQQTYHELNSDDEHLNEMMSTHTIPSGNFKEDWLTSEHLFKMPRGEGCNVSRDWLCRIDYQGACIERKLYCPQVGDSVVYIPRAHYDTLQKYPFPSYSMPWKSWPELSSWPVVWCKVTHIRYRFPYKSYYKARRQDEKLQGVAAILTLRIYGTPLSNNRNFPWPAPNFTPLSSDWIEFEVTVFECNEDDFIIPEYLYSWRIKELERAIDANFGNANGISVTVHCPPDNDNNCHSAGDTNRSGYTGCLVRINERSEAEHHFVESGYNALSMKWDSIEGSENTNQPIDFSAWNISVNNPSCNIPPVPTMGEDVKKAVKAALHTATNLDPEINELFSDLVDTSQYTDYLEMIEVPMYLSFIQKRLRSNYYTNKSSVVADMELVKENCYKYNEYGNGYYALACRMYGKFKYLVHCIEESDATSQIHSSKSTSAFGSTSLETAQEQPPFCSISIAQQQHSGDCIPNLDNVSDSSDRRMISRDDVPGKAEPCAQAGSGHRLTTETRDDENRHREESETKVLSSCKPSTGENIAQRPTIRSAQQTIEVGRPSRRINLRATKKSSNAANYSEEKQQLESSDDNESDAEHFAEEYTAKAEPSAQISNSKESDTETSDDEDDYHQGGEFSQTKVQSQSKYSSDLHIEENVSNRPTRQSAQQLQAAKARGPSRRIQLRKKRKPSYEEKDSEGEEYAESSEEDESDDELSIEEEVSRQKRKGRHTNDDAARKKRGRVLGQKKRSENYPDLEMWCPVSKGKISEVGRAVLDKLRDLDHLELFSRPVCEDFPSLADSYLREVKNPMDFRTIEHERLPTYGHISQLQEDLILTFRNCCIFNREPSEYFSYALKFWQTLNDIYYEVRAFHFCDTN